MRLPLMLSLVLAPCWAMAQSASLTLESDAGGKCVMTCGATSVAAIDIAEMQAKINELTLEVAALKYLRPSPPASPPPSPPPPPPSPPPAAWKLSAIDQSCTEACAESQLFPDLDVMRGFAITARNLDAAQINAHLGLGDICSSNGNSGAKENIPWVNGGNCRFYHDADDSISEMNPNSRHSYAQRLCYCNPVQWVQFSHWVPGGSTIPVIEQGMRAPAFDAGNFLAEQSWALSCEAAEMIGLDGRSDSKVVMKVAMGTLSKGENHVVDYFRPRDGVNFCEVLKTGGSNSKHEWSPDGLKFYDPNVDCVSDAACGYYDSHQGGSAGSCTASPSVSWLQTNIRAGSITDVSPADDTRVFVTFWSDNAGTIGSGCCYQEYTAGCDETTCQCQSPVWGYPTDIYVKAAPEYKTYRSCKAALAAGETMSKVYMIHFGSPISYPVYCDQVTNAGGWSLLLTVIDATNDLAGDFPYTRTNSAQGAGSFTPFKKDLNALTPSLTEPYARDWTSSGPIGLLPSVGDGIMITRGGDTVSDFVTMQIAEWCGGKSWEENMGQATACGSSSHDLPGFASGHVFDKDGWQILPTMTQRPDTMFNFNGCSHVGGCGSASPGDGAAFSTHIGWAEPQYNCYGGCFPAQTNGANGAALHWNGEILVDGGGTRAREPLSYWFREAN